MCLNWGNIIIPIATAFISFISSYFLSTKQSAKELIQLKESNQHEIEKLMQQHKIDIDSLKEKHQLEMEAKEKEHLQKMEIIRLEHENAIILNEKQLENTTKFSALGDMLSGSLGQSIMNSPEVKEQLNKAIKDAFNKPKQ